MINPCEEGTHDCFDNNFVDCVFVASEQFRCENCETGYLNETNSDGDAVCTGKSCGVYSEVRIVKLPILFHPKITLP